MEILKLQATNWITHEPTGILWLAVVAALLFAASLSHSGDRDKNPWTWARALVESCVTALLFIGMAWMGYFLLTRNYEAFEKIHHSFTQFDSDSYKVHQQWKKIYGESFFQQNDLEVTQYQTVDTVEVVPIGDPPVDFYRNAKTEKAVSQNDITRFRGYIVIQGVDWNQRDSTFNAYSMSAAYDYEIVNSQDSVTRAEFRFPLFGGSKLYQDVMVKVNQVEIEWNIQDGAIVWERVMQPGEAVSVSVQYSTWSMDGLQFKIVNAREVRDFKLTIAIDTALC
jgi:hypothetical protein